MGAADTQMTFHLHVSNFLLTPTPKKLVSPSFAVRVERCGHVGGAKDDEGGPTGTLGRARNGPQYGQHLQSPSEGAGEAIVAALASEKMTCCFLRRL